jgi:hypothetical protein
LQLFNIFRESQDQALNEFRNGRLNKIESFEQILKTNHSEPRSQRPLIILNANYNLSNEMGYEEDEAPPDDQQTSRLETQQGPLDKGKAPLLENQVAPGFQNQQAFMPENQETSFLDSQQSLIVENQQATVLENQQAPDQIEHYLFTESPEDCLSVPNRWNSPLELSDLHFYRVDSTWSMD